MTIQPLRLSLKFYPEKFLPLEILNLLQTDPHPGDVVVSAGAVRVPDSHHQAHLVQLRQRHLGESCRRWSVSLVNVITDLEFKLGFKGRIQSFVESFCLFISILEVGRPIVRQQVDQGVGVLAPLTVQVLIVRQRNVNIILADFDLRTLAESM